MTLGFVIEFKPIDAANNTKFHHKLFGRLQKVYSKNRTIYYYRPGMLDNIKFIKIANQKYFIENIDSIETKEIEQYTKYLNIIPFSFMNNNLTTGREYWNKLAAEKEISFIIKFNKNKTNRKPKVKKIIEIKQEAIEIKPTIQKNNETKSETLNSNSNIKIKQSSIENKSTNLEIQELLNKKKNLNK